ncbi:hypothetical protein GCM10009867_30470 [Pedococcus aerophilus]|uniref:ATPase n=1 Tax=Pedococcus aerophilus TaxID=436356 RepID=A0ABP6HAY2_9MICO
MTDADRSIAQVRALLGEMRGIRADIDRQTREAVAEHQKYLASVEKKDEDRAKKARAGELGADWQRLQRRIDLGETSLTAIVHGIDDSSAAESVRRTAAENAAEVSRVQAQELGSREDSAAELQVAFSSAQQHLREMYAQMEQIAAKPLPRVD